LGFEIYHRYSDDYGLNWSNRHPLSTPEPIPYCEDSQWQSAYVDPSGNIAVFWFDYKYGSLCGFTGDILGRVSRDNGTTWLPECRISNDQGGEASTCLILNDTIHISWMDCYPMGCGCSKIVYSRSTDWGSSWTTPEVITGPIQTSEGGPDIVYSVDSAIHCILSKDIAGNGVDLFYLRDRGFSSISDAEINKLAEPISITVYPNPFNSSSTIGISGSSEDNTSLDIFNIMGQRVKHFDLGFGENTNLIWDATDSNNRKLTSGVYLIKVSSGSVNKYTKINILK
jgi:hypothetical protein